MPISEHIRQLREKVGHDLLMMPGVAAVILNAEGAILLQQRPDNRHWGLPGGAIEPGEEPAEALVREVREETGLEVVVERLTGVYGGAAGIGQYPNGDRFAIINMTFVCRVVGGTLSGDPDETADLRYFPPDDLPEMLTPRHRQRIEHALTRSEPYFKGG